MAELAAILGLAFASALWVVVQRWARRLDPAEPGVRRCCGGCALPCGLDDEARARAGGAREPGHAPRAEGRR